MNKHLLVVVAAIVFSTVVTAQTPASPKQLAPDHAQLEKVATASGAVGMYDLGRRYQLGAGVPINYEQAVIWLQKAVDAGHAPAMTKLALMYGFGSGVPEDNARFVALLERAAALGDPQGMAYYALHGPQPYSPTKPGIHPEAAKLMARAADAGDPHALFYRYLEKAGEPIGRAIRQQVIKGYQPYVEMGDLDALDDLSLIYPDFPDPFVKIKMMQEFLPHAERAAQAGNGFAAAQMASMYFFLEFQKVPSSEGKKLLWARKAADMGNSRGKYLLSIYTKP